MSPLHLTIVIPRAPWCQALVDGTVAIPGVTYECNSDFQLSPDRFSATKRCDVGENGIRFLALDLLKGAPRVAIPVFLGREHMQRNIIVLEDSSLSHPSELAGKTIGTSLPIVAGVNIGVMLMLEQAYSVRLADIEWHTSDPHSLVHNRMGLTLKRGPQTDGENLDRLLRREVDAVIVRTGPRYWSMFGGNKLDQTLAGRSGLRSLIGDPEMIAATYKGTGLYPITDIGVVSAGIQRLDPELPSRLVDAFSHANDMASRYRSEEEEALARREIELLGENPHHYGLQENPTRTLRLLLELLARLGALERVVEPEELFVPCTRCL